MPEVTSFGAAFGQLVKLKRGAQGVTLAELARRAYPNLGDDAETRKGDLSKLENGKVLNPNASTVRKIADALGITDEEIETLQRRARSPLSDQLRDIAVLSRDELELLASRFEAERPHTRSDADLKDFLTKKAEEYRCVRAEIEAIPDHMLRLSNFKATAKAAFAAGNLDEVEQLLSEVQTVEVEEAARTTEARAEIALLRNRVEDAFRLLSHAADLFSVVDPAAPAHRRGAYIERLARHGERFGGTGLAYAIRMGRDSIARLDRTAAELAWATVQQNLANVLLIQGRRVGGAAGIAILAEAIMACREALTVFTRTSHPTEWAATMQILADALQTKGTRTAGEDGAALLSEAVAAYQLALEVRTRSENPVDWATTMQALARAVQTQGTHISGKEGSVLLAEALAIYRQSLEATTRAVHPMEWAAVMQNIANALRAQGTGKGGKAGTELLAEAVMAYRQALSVFTLADHPVNWAMTQENMAICELAWSEHPACADPLPHLRAALEYVDAALTVFDPVHMSFYHQKATALRADILAALSGPDAAPQ